MTKTGNRLAALAASAALLAVAACAVTTPAPEMAAGAMADDREAIEYTLYRYARGLDRRDPDLYASAWAVESEFQVADTLYEGREGMRSIITGLNDGSVAGPTLQTLHMDTNSRLEFLAPDHAMHHAYYVTLGRSVEGPDAAYRIIAAGSTIDELRKIDGEWLIVKRSIIDGP